MGRLWDFACALPTSNFTRIFKEAKQPAVVPANRHFKYKEVIAMCNTPGTLFIRFLILFGLFILLVPIR